jgi:hypothetical protein
MPYENRQTLQEPKYDMQHNKQEHSNYYREVHLQTSKVATDQDWLGCIIWSYSALLRFVDCLYCDCIYSRPHHSHNQLQWMVPCTYEWHIVHTVRMCTCTLCYMMTYCIFLYICIQLCTVHTIDVLYTELPPLFTAGYAQTGDSCTYTVSYWYVQYKPLVQKDHLSIETTVSWSGNH